MKHYVTLIIAFTLAFWAVNCMAQEYTDKEAIRAIVGEASNQGYDGMYAVACSVKNRGHLRGVYGLKAPHVESEPSWVWKMASEAFYASLQGTDVTNGATHWESTDFPTPYWVKDMEITYKLGKHVFYKAKARQSKRTNRK